MYQELFHAPLSRPSPLASGTNWVSIYTEHDFHSRHRRQYRRVALEPGNRRQKEGPTYDFISRRVERIEHRIGLANLVAKVSGFILP